MKRQDGKTIVEDQKMQEGLSVRMFSSVDSLMTTIGSLAKRVFISHGIQSVLAGRNVSPELVREARCQFHSPMRAKDIGTVLANRNSRWTVCIAMRVLTMYQARPNTGLILPYYFGSSWGYIEAIFFNSDSEESNLSVMFSQYPLGDTPFRFETDSDRFDVALPVD
jgi:hypothetical protein